MAGIQPIIVIDYNNHYALATVQMWRASMEQALGITDHHTWQEQLDYLERLAQTNSVRLAVDQATNQVVGIMAVEGAELNQLYIHTEYQGRGIGTQLLDLAKALSPGQLYLYTFEVNKKAQRFYEQHGFIIIGRGVEQESGMADIRYQWVKDAI